MSVFLKTWGCCWVLLGTGTSLSSPTWPGTDSSSVFPHCCLPDTPPTPQGCP